jgi:AcrR family transcriptional regulator
VNTTEPPKPVRRRTGGRSARVREAVLSATVTALAEIGPRGVTMNEIARRAGVHATSIQRRWGSVEALILDAMLNYSHEHLPIPDTGTLRGDLAAFAGLLLTYLTSAPGTALARAMAAAEDDPTLTDGRARFWQTRFRMARPIIDRAIDRGELPTDTDAAFALELLIAPLHFRQLLTRQPIDHTLIEQTVNLIVRGLGAPAQEMTAHPMS